jgi:hypothetical protein
LPIGADLQRPAYQEATKTDLDLNFRIRAEER